PPRAHDLRAERRPDRLVAQTHAEDGDLAGKPAYAFHADPRLRRRARPRRDHDALGRQRSDTVEVHLVVPPNDGLRAQLPEELDEVPGERVVIVDDEDHRPAGLALLV